jgi:hypothetical protein
MDFAPNHAFETLIVDPARDVREQDAEASLKHGVSLRLVAFEVDDVASLPRLGKPLLGKVVLGQCPAGLLLELDVFCNDVFVKRCKLASAEDVLVTVRKARGTFMLSLSLRGVVKDSSGNVYVVLSAPVLKVPS